MIGQSVLNEVAEVFEFDGEVNIVNHHFFRDEQHIWREVEDSHYPALNEGIGNFLSNGSRDRKNRHFDFSVTNKLREVLHSENRLADLLFPFAVRFDIKTGDDLEPFFFESTIREEGKTQVPDADEEYRLQARGAEFIGNLFGKLDDTIAETAGAELSEISKILAKLSRLHPRDLGQSLTGYGVDIVILKPSQAPEVKRKPVNGLSRDFRGGQLFHVRNLYTSVNLPRCGREGRALKRRRQAQLSELGGQENRAGFGRFCLL